MGLILSYRESKRKQKQSMEVFCKWDVLWPACNFIKKRLLHSCFSYEFWEISKNTFFTEHFQAAASGSMQWFIVKTVSVPIKSKNMIREKIASLRQFLSESPKQLGVLGGVL